jgi:hypothetical protein
MERNLGIELESKFYYVKSESIMNRRNKAGQIIGIIKIAMTIEWG